MISPGLRFVWDEGLALRVLAHARRGGRYDLAGMFLELPPLDARLEPPPPPLPRAMAKLPLGVRRSLARRNDIGLIERLLGDPDPAVIENLLNNPRITELEVVRMAARSPVREEVLAAISRHPRWGIRHRVRVTLAHNPGTPTGITLGLLHLLLDQELEALAKDGRLSQVVTSRAEALLAAPRSAEPVEDPVSARQTEAELRHHQQRIEVRRGRQVEPDLPRLHADQRPAEMKIDAGCRVQGAACRLQA